MLQGQCGRSSQGSNTLYEFYRALLGILGNNEWLSDLKVDQAGSLCNPGDEQWWKQDPQERWH